MEVCPGRRTSDAELQYFSFQIRSSLFEHGAVMGIPTLLKLLQHATERQAKVLSFAKPARGFLCQTWLLGCVSPGSFVLLCFDGLALPASGHGVSITFRRSSVAIAGNITGMLRRPQRSRLGKNLFVKPMLRRKQTLPLQDESIMPLNRGI